MSTSIPHLFVDISSHGFGHLAITAPVLNRLADLVPDLRLTIRSGLPPAKLAQRIHVPYALIQGSTDFGYVMHDATRIDLAASAAAYRAAHSDWASRVASEAAFLKSLAPDRVLTNVSYLPLAGAARYTGRRPPAATRKCSNDAGFLLPAPSDRALPRRSSQCLTSFASWPGRWRRRA